MRPWRRLLIDVETRSVVDLEKAGARRYAADASTRITCVSWHWAGDSVIHSACGIPGLEYLGSDTMDDFIVALIEADEVVAHHINFDAAVIFSTLGPCGLTLEKLNCTMARAQRMSLPGGLYELCHALDVPSKDAEGRRLVMATCKPMKNGLFNEDPVTFRDLIAYNVQDIRCLVSVDQILPQLPPEELRIWRRTWRKNTFGLPLDVDLCEKVAKHRANIELQLTRDLGARTNLAITAVTQRERLLKWVRKYGIDITNTQRATLEGLFESDDIDLDVWTVLEMFLESGGSAPTKAQALLDRHVRGRFQDATRYFGARSGRGTSEGVNMFNLARPSGKHDPAEIIRALKAYPNGEFDNTQLSDVLRGAVCAPPGYKLIDADESNIELRLSLWFANDLPKLKLLREGLDLYAYTAGKSMGIPGLTKLTHPKERQGYKKVVLSGGYGVGENKLYISFKTDRDLPYEYRRDLTRDQVSAIHRGYRQENVLLQESWDELEKGFRMALLYRGSIIETCKGKISFQHRLDMDVLDLRLPSGRVIPHWRPSINEHGQLTFWRAWHGRMMECRTWGGGIMEIICQSSARDVITTVEAAIEDELPDVIMILDIYDSVVCLAPEAVAEQRLQQIIEIMRRPLYWSEGLPLDAEGYVDERMRK